MNRTTRFAASLRRADPRGAEDDAGAPGHESAWAFTAQIAVIGIFLLLFVAFLSLARNILLPVVSAFIIGIMLSPLGRAIDRRVPAVLFATATVGAIVAAIQVALMLLTTPVARLIERAPELGPALKQKFAFLEPMVAQLKAIQNAILPGSDGGGLNIDVASFVQPAMAFLTPAAGELILFLATLFLFLVSREGIRRHLIMAFPEQDERLSVIRIVNDVEHKLTRYIGTVTAINVVLGLITALGAYLVGLPSPALFGVLAFVCNYVPYIGPGVVLVVLFGVGLIVFPSVGQALIPPALFLALTGCEGHLITPNVMGRTFTVNALAVFLSLSFWTWLWGPVGGFLSVPLLIVGLVILTHVFPKSENELPG